MVRQVATLFITVLICVFSASEVLAFIPAQQREIDIKSIAFERPLSNKLSSEKIALVVPMGMKPTKDTDSIKGQIVDQSLQSLMTGAYFSDSDIFDSVKKIEDAMKAGVTLGGTEPGSIQHKVEMRVDAFQQKANFSYQGLVDADVKVNGSNNSLEIEVKRAITDHSRLKLNHQTDSQRSFVQMNFDW